MSNQSLPPLFSITPDLISFGGFDDGAHGGNTPKDITLVGLQQISPPKMPGFVDPSKLWLGDESDLVPKKRSSPLDDPLIVHRACSGCRRKEGSCEGQLVTCGPCSRSPGWTATCAHVTPAHAYAAQQEVAAKERVAVSRDSRRRPSLPLPALQPLAPKLIPVAEQPCSAHHNVADKARLKELVTSLEAERAEHEHTKEELSRLNTYSALLEEAKQTYQQQNLSLAKEAAEAKAEVERTRREMNVMRTHSINAAQETARLTATFHEVKLERDKLERQKALHHVRLRRHRVQLRGAQERIKWMQSDRKPPKKANDPEDLKDHADQLQDDMMELEGDPQDISSNRDVFTQTEG